MKKTIAFTLLWLSVIAFLKSAAFATPQPQVVVPFQMQNQHMFFQLTINGSHPLNFIFDTGAATMVLNPETAKELGLTEAGVISAKGVGGVITAPRYQDIPIALGKIKFKTQAVGFPVKHLEQRIGRTIDGIIGADLLYRYVLEMNYDQKELRFFGFDDFRYQGKGEKIRIKLKSRLATCRLSVTTPDGKRFRGRFLIDSGAGDCLDFTRHFTRKHKLRQRFSKTYRLHSSGATTTKTYFQMAKLSGLKLGQYSFKGVPISMTNTKGGVLGSFKNGGILGNRILKRFNITLNYQKLESYWEPNQSYRASIQHNCTGILVYYTPDLKQLLVRQIVTGSAAAKAGLKEEDLLLTVNGKKVQAKDKSWLLKLMAKPGQVINIKIKRKGEIKQFRLTAQSLI
ncbi:hypothetical protein BKI52_03765 [marine bacterium AO1-C]|nr:hypothetical protein BKI52_03765 [marine bacterium AO1-C]